MRTLSKHLGRPATIEDVKGLTKEVAKEIYSADYYFGPRIHTLVEAVQPQVVDIAINSGPAKAVRMLQEVCNLAGFECSVDGVVGPRTRQVVETAYKAMGGLLINALSEYREHFFNTIVAKNPSQSVFLKGWIKRAREFRVDAV
jgi:lysozyme family protein